MHLMRISTSLLLFTIVGCKDDGSPVAPVREPSNLVINGSFEVNGNPTLEGWTGKFDPDTTLKACYTFTNDVPAGGGNWSFAFENPAQDLWLRTHISAPGQFCGYRLAFWAKSTVVFTEASLLVSSSGSQTASGKRITIRDSVWRQYSVAIGVGDTSLYEDFTDSIRILQIELRCSHNPSVIGRAQFDDLRLSKLE